MDAPAIRKIARAISDVENRTGEYETLLREAYRAPSVARVIGVTGPPGVGKSTLVDGLAAHWASIGDKVAILAIDPSSPYYGGALLGDRVRQSDSADFNDVYFRSLSSRGHVGGLSAATAEITAILNLYGFGHVLIETVGAGQSDIEVREVDDCTLVMLVPGLGDGVQAAKAGMMEIGDVFAVNKCDRPGGEDAARAIERSIAAAYAGEPGINRREFLPHHRLPALPASEALALRHGNPATDETSWTPPVLRTSAANRQGIAPLAHAIDGFLDWSAATGRQAARRRVQIEGQIRQTVSAMILEALLAPGNADGAMVTQWVDEISAGKASPLDAARSLAAKLLR
jgi:LAO/AO transport system kinase